MDVNYIDDQALTDILATQNLSDCGESYEKVAKLSVRDAFDAYLTWNGIIGHTDEFIKVYESIKTAQQKAWTQNELAACREFNKPLYAFADKETNN